MLVKDWRSNTEDLIQIVFDAIDHQFGAACFSNDTGHHAMKNTVCTATQAHCLADQCEGQVAGNCLVSKRRITRTRA